VGTSPAALSLSLSLTRDDRQQAHDGEADLGLLLAKQRLRPVQPRQHERRGAKGQQKERERDRRPRRLVGKGVEARVVARGVPARVVVVVVRVDVGALWGCFWCCWWCCF
jgi:hypothetical protein